MRNKTLYALGAVAALLLAVDFYKIFDILPDEANQGAIYRIIYLHVPSAATAFTFFTVAMGASVLYLITGKLKYDAVSAALIEVGLAFAAIVLVTGSIWARIIWGVWWAWEARLTTMLICWLTYAGYLMLRRAVEEPTQRARLSSVLSIFGFAEVVIVYKANVWWRTLHPGPVLSIRNGGGMAPGMESVIYWNMLAFVCLAAIMVVVRMRQEEVAREIDSLRRMAHSY